MSGYCGVQQRQKYGKPPESPRPLVVGEADYLQRDGFAVTQPAPFSPSFARAGYLGTAFYRPRRIVG